MRVIITKSTEYVVIHVSCVVPQAICWSSDIARSEMNSSLVVGIVVPRWVNTSIQYCQAPLNKGETGLVIWNLSFSTRFKKKNTWSGNIYIVQSFFFFFFIQSSERNEDTHNSNINKSIPTKRCALHRRSARELSAVGRAGGRVGGKCWIRDHPHAIGLSPNRSRN